MSCKFRVVSSDILIEVVRFILPLADNRILYNVYEIDYDIDKKTRKLLSSSIEKVLLSSCFYRRCRMEKIFYENFKILSYFYEFFLDNSKWLQ